MLDELGRRDGARPQRRGQRLGDGGRDLRDRLDASHGGEGMADHDHRRLT